MSPGAIICFLCTFQTNMNLIYCHVLAAIFFVSFIFHADSSPYSQICSQCVPDDLPCIAKCSYLEPEVTKRLFQYHVFPKRKRYQHQLRFGKRNQYEVTIPTDEMNESFRPQLRFGKRSGDFESVNYMPHMRFGKRAFVTDVHVRSFQPQGRFGRSLDKNVPYVKEPSILHSPYFTDGQELEKRFRPQGRFGKRRFPFKATAEDSDLYTGKLLL